MEKMVFIMKKQKFYLEKNTLEIRFYSGKDGVYPYKQKFYLENDVF